MNERGLLAQGQKVMTIKTGDITEKLCTIEANLGSIFERVEVIKTKVGLYQQACDPTVRVAPQTIYGYAERLSCDVGGILSDLIAIENALNEQLGDMPLR